MKKRVNITIEDHVLNKVDEMARERGIDRSTMISVLIYDASQIIEMRNTGDVSQWQIDSLGQI